jgi:hypothetical protein
MLRIVLGLAVSCALSAAVADPPALPDPIGLGERLVLLDHLRDAYGQRPPPGATLEELRALYATAWQATQAKADPGLEDHGQAEREQRLRNRLSSRHGVQADPDLGEAALIALLRRLDAERAARDQQAIADLVAADQGRPPAAEVTAKPADVTAQAATDPASPSSQATTTTTPQPAVRSGKPVAIRVRFNAPGVADCWLATSGERSCLLVTFGIDHNGAFGTIREDMWAQVSQATAFRRSVLLLGHGGGTDVGGENIEAHLKANKRFYETMGETLPAAPVECLVFASCSAGNPDQMRAMRDGLGYFPTWRVATGPRAYATGFSVIAAITDVARKPAKPAWRGLYRMGTSGDTVGAFGEVGIDGERAETSYWRLIPDEKSGTWKTVEQR